MGDHTDYNDGYVLPAAIDLRTRVSIVPRSDGRICAKSIHYAAKCEFDLDGPVQPAGDWGDYVRGTLVELQSAGHRVAGIDMLIESDLPSQAGLGSSAALEVVCGYAALKAGNEAVDLLDLARAAHRGESKFVGTHCGLMDQLIACVGQAGYAVLIDCRSVECRPVTLSPQLKIVIANTMVRRSLASSDYNQRRAECDSALQALNQAGLRLNTLRDIDSVGTLDRVSLSDSLMRRCRHVVTENRRVLDMAAALRGADLAAVGRLMAESHASLRDDYEVSCGELDLMVDLAVEITGVVGARMTGGGFGGCTVNLVMRPAAERFCAVLKEKYERATGITPGVYACESSHGVCEEP